MLHTSLNNSRKGLHNWRQEKDYVVVIQLGLCYFVCYIVWSRIHKDKVDEHWALFTLKQCYWLYSFIPFNALNSSFTQAVYSSKTLFLLSSLGQLASSYSSAFRLDVRPELYPLFSFSFYLVITVVSFISQCDDL